MDNEQVEHLIRITFRQAKAQFGKAVKAYWYHDSRLCPGCGRKIDSITTREDKAISLNAFIYRERGVLIGYFLCSRCARHIFREAKKNPHQQTALHSAIEANLIEAYQKYLSGMNA